ncbi:hypothetical protein QQP08_001847 [Theobroma cacao]|nr:hypothetical protein QQP08_001847 [Theobroma cacao]
MCPIRSQREDPKGEVRLQRFPKKEEIWDEEKRNMPVGKGPEKSGKDIRFRWKGENGEETRCAGEEIRVVRTAERALSWREIDNLRKRIGSEIVNPFASFSFG